MGNIKPKILDDVAWYVVWQMSILAWFKKSIVIIGILIRFKMVEPSLIKLKVNLKFLSGKTAEQLI